MYVTYVPYKYRLYPTKAQREYFAKVFGCVRFVYNKMLEDSEKYYKETGKRLMTNPSSYKDEFPFLREVDSSALSNAKMSLDQAYSRFFKKETNRPRFKSKKDNHHSYSTNMLHDNIRIDGSYVRLPKVKFVKAKIHRTFSGRIHKASVTKTPAGDYFVILLVDTEVEKLPKSEKSIGIDLGVLNTVTDTNGNIIKNVKARDRYAKKLARENRRMKRKKDGSKNREKQRIKLNKVYRKIVNVRGDFLHKLSRNIVNENQVIACEDIKVMEIIKQNFFAGDIYDASWNKFLGMLKYKSEWYGRDFVQVGRFFPSSQVCSFCGEQNPAVKNTNIKKWTCPSCGAIHQRDLNASRNILLEGRRVLFETTGDSDYLDYTNISIDICTIEA